MSSKDRTETLTKEGCARVNVSKITNIIHSYTLECGFHCSNFLNTLKPCTNIHRKNKGYKYLDDELDNINSDIYKKNNYYYNIPMYENLGKALVLTVLDVF